MTGSEINDLIRVGATDRVRKKLKRMGLKDRLKVLHKCIPYVNVTTESLKFFKENFSLELGAIMMASEDLDKAESLYRSAKN